MSNNLLKLIYLLFQGAGGNTQTKQTHRLLHWVFLLPTRTAHLGQMRCLVGAQAIVQPVYDPTKSHQAQCRFSNVLSLPATVPDHTHELSFAHKLRWSQRLRINISFLLLRLDPFYGTVLGRICDYLM